MITLETAPPETECDGCGCPASLETDIRILRCMQPAKTVEVAFCVECREKVGVALSAEAFAVVVPDLTRIF